MTTPARLAALVLAAVFGVLPAVAVAQSFPPGGLAKPPRATDPAPASVNDAGARGKERAGDYAPGEVLVRFRSSAGAAGRSAALRAQRSTVKRVLPVPGLRTVKLPEGTAVEEAVRRFEADARVLYAEPNYRVRNQSVPNDPEFSKLWGLHNTGQTLKGFGGTADADIDAPEAWDMTRGSSSVLVASVDGGIAFQHSDLENNIWVNPRETVNGADDDGNGFVDDRRGWDWVAHTGTSQTNCSVGDNDPMDENGHGSHTAGTIGAYGDNGYGVTGVAQRVSIMPLRVTNAQGQGEVDDIICAFRYAAANGAKLVNASVGGDFTSSAMNDSVSSNPGVTFIVSAGNDAKDTDVQNQMPCNIPAANLICVAATDANDNLWLDSDSFWGVGAGAGSNYGDTHVDLAAPGMFTYSSSPFRSLFRDDFDGFNYVSRWKEPTANPFTIEYPASGPTDGFTLSDSGGAYANNSNYNTEFGVPVSTVGYRDCQVNFRLVDISTEESEPTSTTPYDYLAIDYSSGGGTWTENQGRYYSGASRPGSRRMLLPDNFENQGQFWMRYRMVSDGSVTGDGAHVDDLDFRCIQTARNYDNTSFGWDSGTSMATPHVAGAAALLLAVRPDLTSAQIKSTLMETGDARSSLSGKTVSGKRLNAASAVARWVAPDTTITSGPSTTNSSSATFYFTSNQAGSTFECSRDEGVSYFPCSSGVRFDDYTTHGSKTFKVRAINRAGTPDPAAATWTWVVDKQAPDTAIKGKPSSPTKETSASFTYSSNETGVTYECSRDQGVSYAACPAAGITYSSLTPNQTHHFHVRARDAAGNVDPAAASHSWYIDQNAPDTELRSRPADPTNQTTATFTFVGSETGSTFECSRDQGVTYTACSSGVTYSGLTHGRKYFNVRAKDVAGNVDPAAASYSWVVDLQSPETTIISGPAEGSSTTSTIASFGFQTDETGATFQCSLDGAAFTACAHPQEYTGLAVGRHTFSVRSRDIAGNLDSSAATRTWTVASAPPGSTVSVSGARASLVSSAGVTSVISVSRSGSTHRFSDSGAPLTPGAGCVAVTASEVTCTSTSITALSVSLGDGDDRLTSSSSLPMTVDAGAGDDTVTGGTGPDRFDGGTGGDVIGGGGGTDTVSYASRTGAVSVDIDGVRDDGSSVDATAVTSRDDVKTDIENLVGGAGSDTLTGSAAANSFDGGAGGDTMAGGGGIDTVSYASRSVAVSVDIDGVRDDGSSYDASTVTSRDNVKTDIENLVGGAGSDTLTGSAAANRFDGGAGGDTMAGGGGIDTVSYASRTVAVSVDIDGVPDDGSSYDGSTATSRDNVMTDIENLIGGAGGDLLTALAATVTNVLTGGAGDDAIKTRDGNDRVDTISCGSGTDRFDRDAGDIVSLCETAVGLP